MNDANVNTQSVSVNMDTYGSRQAIDMGSVAAQYLADKGFQPAQLEAMAADGTGLTVASRTMKAEQYLRHAGMDDLQIQRLGPNMLQAATLYDQMAEEGPVDANEFFHGFKRNQDGHFQRQIAGSQYESIDEAAQGENKPGIAGRIVRHPLTKVAASVAVAAGIGYAMLGDAQPANADTITDLTHYTDTSNGLTVVSDVFFDSGTGWNVFDYKVTNETGDTLFEAKFFGQDWEAGYGQNQSWLTEIAASAPAVPLVDFIRFYDSNLDSGFNEEFIAGSSWIDTWAIGTAEFQSTQGNTYQVDVLKPSAVPEPSTLVLSAIGFAAVAAKLKKRKQK